MQYFMLDIETMGTNPKSDDIIQIAILEVLRQKDGTYQAGNAFCRTLHTSQKPTNDWVANQHRKLLQECRRTPPTTPEKIRAEILSFFEWCGAEKPVKFIGLNLMSLDIPFLVEKGILEAPTVDRLNRLNGDFHYRIYELRGGFNLAEDVTGLSGKELFEAAERLAPDVTMPEGRAHEALFDCYKQLKTLNGLIRLLKVGA